MERKILTPHEIIDRIAEQIVSARKQSNCEFSRTYDGQESLSHVHLSLLTFVL